MNDTFYKKYPPVISVDNEEGLVFANLIFRLFSNFVMGHYHQDIKTSNKYICH